MKQKTNTRILPEEKIRLKHTPKALKSKQAYSSAPEFLPFPQAPGPFTTVVIAK